MGLVLNAYQKFRVAIAITILLILVANLILSAIAAVSPVSRGLSIASAVLNGVGVLLASILIGAYVYNVNAEVHIDTSQFQRDELKED